LFLSFTATEFKKNKIQLRCTGDSYTLYIYNRNGNKNRFRIDFDSILQNIPFC